MLKKNVGLCFKTIVALLPILLTFPAAAESTVYTRLFSNVAISGYDSVAYFTEDKAVKGSPRYKLNYKGAEWHFKSADNLAAFKKDPEAFAPQYGGYCAWAVGNNKLAKGDPKHWSRYNGKLYLNYNAQIKDRWLADKKRLVPLANGYWPQLTQ